MFNMEIVSAVSIFVRSMIPAARLCFFNISENVKKTLQSIRLKRIDYSVLISHQTLSGAFPFRSVIIDMFL